MARLHPELDDSLDQPPALPTNPVQSPPILHCWVIFVHLFSGRRREGDLHDVIQQSFRQQRQLLVISVALVNKHNVLEAGMEKEIND